MGIRMIAISLLFCTFFGLFGCTAAAPKVEADFGEEQLNFIGEKSEDLNAVTSAERPEKLMNFAETDENGNPLYQIVYAAGASDYMIDECFVFQKKILDITGVTVPCVNALGKQKTHEILIGDIARMETVDVKDQYRLSESDFVIRTVGTRVMIYGKTEQAIIAGLMLFEDSFAYFNEDTAEFGIGEEFEYLYQPVEHPPVTIVGSDEHYVEFALQNSDLLATYARLSFTGNGGWRIQTKVRKSDEYQNMGAAQRLSYSLGEEDPSLLEKISCTNSDGVCVITAADGSRAEIKLALFEMNFYTPSGTVAATVTNLTSYAGGSSITGALTEDEAIFGTGERFNGTNQRGNYIEMFTKDIWSRADACYMAIPLLCSSRGSGIFINRYEHMTLDLGKEQSDVWKAVLTGAPLDVYVYTTEQITDVIRAYSELTGYAEMPEEWTYGMIVCAINPELSKKWTAQITPKPEGERLRGEGVYEMIANMEKYDLPWTGVLAEPFGAYHSATHDDLKELCDYVHSFGKKFLVYTRVGFAGTYMAADARLSTRSVFGYSSSYMVSQTSPSGTSILLPDTTSTVINPDVGADGQKNSYLDITNPDAVNWFFGEYWDYLANDIGVDGCKIDFCETMPENYKLNYYDKSMPTAGTHHWYPTAFCSMFWDMISSKPDSGMCYTRGGGIGSQRAPYMWAGDQKREFTSLPYQLSAVLSSGLSGVPFMSYDMSGYHYGYNMEGETGPLHNIEYEAQVFLRGTQFTAYTICMQTHGRVRRAYQFANENPEYLYATEIYRAYTKLHEHLTPYITELCEEAVTTGMPAMRHLILGWQDDKNVYDIEDEYTFGDAFLIAPILDDGDSRDVYLPKGEWLDLNTGDSYSVGNDGLLLENYAASIAEVPTFYNKNTKSEIAPTLIDGIMELYDYARGFAE